MSHFTIDNAAVARLRAERSVDDSVRRIADDIFRESQSRVPVDTGELKRSGFVEGSDSEYRIGYTADHAGYVEFGTSHMDAQPYLTPSAMRRR